MFDRLKKLFGLKKEEPPQEANEELLNAWYEEKSKLMEGVLGREHDIVMHAMIPYAIGGALDLYYFPNGVAGTCVATKELCEVPEGAPSNRNFSCYELAMFTRHPINLNDAKSEETAFGKAHSNINSVLNLIARYTGMATLNGNETCEFPAEMEKVGGKCLIFDSYGTAEPKNAQKFGILAVIEIHRSEMEYARANGGSELIRLLKEAGHYPYSDLDRDSVVPAT